MTAAIEKIPASEARERVEKGEAWLICAYEDEKKCEEKRLDGALTLGEFQSKLQDESAKEKNLIFY